MADYGSPIGGLLQGFNQTYWPAMRQNQALALQQAQEKRAQDQFDFLKQKYQDEQNLLNSERERKRNVAGLLAERSFGVKPTMYQPLSGDAAEAAGDFMPSVENPMYSAMREMDPKDVMSLIEARRKERSDQERWANEQVKRENDLRRTEALFARIGAGGAKGKATLFMDEEGKQVVPLVPGQDEIPPGWRPYDKKLFGMGEKFKARLESENENAKLMTKTIDDAMKYADAPLAAGRFSDTVAGVDPESSAYQLRKSIETLKANIGFDRLQAMREASPTGGALGQVAVQELQALQATLGNLDPRQRPEVLKENLKSIRDKYQRIMQKFNSAGSGGGPTSKPADPLGLR